MNKGFLFLAAFVLLAVANGTSDKVQIDLYAESLCPDCKEFVTGQFQIAFNTANISEIATLNVWPYGNARESQSGTSYVFSCQHGAEECAGNLMETCARYNFDSQSFLNFFICLETQIDSYSTFDAAGPVCAQQAGVDFSKIQSCMQSSQGNQYEHQVAQQTESLNPPHQYVPWITVGGNHDVDAENQILQDMVGYICSTYKGSVQIDACKNRQVIVSPDFVARRHYKTQDFLSK